METEVDWSFIRSPKWIASHIGVLLLVLAMIGAGIWQIARHQDRGERNDLIRARASQELVDLGSLVSPGDDIAIGDELQFTRAVVVGEYRVEDEVLIRNRTFDGAPGWWVVTPLVTDEGWAVAVNRGWIPLSFDAEAERPGTEPLTGLIKVQGTIQPSRVAEGFQNADPVEGRLSSLARTDVRRLEAQLDYPLLPVVLQLPEDGSDAQLPFGLALPALDAGPHASYAAQWFIFTTIAHVGYPLILRRVARGRAQSLPDDALPDDA